MRLFTKEDIKADNGHYEIFLTINKQQLLKHIDDEMPAFIKKQAIDHIQARYDHVPIRVVRIMIGSMLYFSFAVNQKKQLSPLT
ncbi:MULTISPECIES: hypothetical protein [Pontibacillus]|uniref:Uncharacterized protein n=1 Tax=Pontibacillus chungwhensis TaxID=265426 RepID=A0ABY8V0W7_9BACI|nr:MULTISPECIES: hypothetical protein [Pontibacillus]MCD5322292.1 hypothetical protein [Pontibacillus sp. HN14]WIF99585.1 hypothetical protein QNI29_07980 [Pontibacillus chungwhensis]